MGQNLGQLLAKPKSSTNRIKDLGQSRGQSALCCIVEIPHPHDERRANLPLRQTLSRHWFTFQRELWQSYERLVRVLELVQLPYSGAGTANVDPPSGKAWEAAGGVSILSRRTGQRPS